MASKTRIYVVSEISDDTFPAKRLVRAISASQAIAHITRPKFAAFVASQDDLADLLPNGVAVEDATKDEA